MASEPHCELFVVGNRRNNIYIDGTQIDTVNHLQFLGVIIDNKINWNDHIKYTCNKICKTLGIINKVKNKLNKKTLDLTYIIHLFTHILLIVT